LSKINRKYRNLRRVLEKEKIMLKWQNRKYIIHNMKLIIYVRTAKGRIFKLVIDENEGYDRIVGYL
jgi:hypothetical protein